MDEEGTFEAYVRARTMALSRVAYLLTGDHHLAEDLVQQALLRVASRWERVVAEGDPDAYVRRVLYHEHVSGWRRRRRRPETLTDVDDTVHHRAPDPSDDLVAAMMVRQALARLAPRQRAVLVLRYFEDLTEVEAAAVLGVRVGTVKSQARDALARIRALAPELAEFVAAAAGRDQA